MSHSSSLRKILNSSLKLHFLGPIIFMNICITYIQHKKRTEERLLHFL
jgi:hypothetical protein